MSRAHVQRSVTLLASDSRAARRGAVLVYVTVMMSVFCAMCSLAVDYGKVQYAKSQLQHGADAAARYGAMALANTLYGTSAASSNAAAAAADCTVDGSPLVLDAVKDVQTGFWDTSRHTFTVYSDPTQCNAVRVQAHHTTARGNAVQLMYARMLGRNTCDINTVAIAMLVPGTSATYTIPDTSNPFLAGMPQGTMASPNNPHNSPDYAGDPKDPKNVKQSPVLADGVGITPGGTMTFDGINGSAYNDYHSSTRVSADGNVGDPGSNNGDIGHNTAGSEHGIADLGNSNYDSGAPLNALVGIFLDDNQPDKTSAPASLDFSTTASRNFQNLQPQLKQIFFIGDGRRDDGQVQTFTVPKGATRLFIAAWDRYEWNNNVGSFTVTLHASGTITMVQ